MKTTFGTAGRKFIDLPQDYPGPGAHRPVHFTEASHNYTIPKAADNYENEIHKTSLLPGPGSYQTQKGVGDLQHLAKSMLGGSIEEKPPVNNGNPAPNAYNLNPLDSIPGFVIKPDTHPNKREEDKNKEPVGPQRYEPHNPNHKKSDHLKHSN